MLCAAWQMLYGMLYKHVSTVWQEAQSIYKALDGNGGVAIIYERLKAMEKNSPKNNMIVLEQGSMSFQAFGHMLYAIRMTRPNKADWYHMSEGLKWPTGFLQYHQLIFRTGVVHGLKFTVSDWETKISPFPCLYEIILPSISFYHQTITKHKCHDSHWTLWRKYEDYYVQIIKIYHFPTYSMF